MTDPGRGVQLGSPDAPAEKKVLPVVGVLVAAGIIGAGVLTGGFGFGAPSVGDCVQAVGKTGIEVVDCGSGNAESRIVGIEDEEPTYDEFLAGDGHCASVERTRYVQWTGADEGEPGTVYCTEPV